MVYRMSLLSVPSKLALNAQETTLTLLLLHKANDQKQVDSFAFIPEQELKSCFMKTDRSWKIESEQMLSDLNILNFRELRINFVSFATGTTPPRYLSAY